MRWRDGLVSRDVRLVLAFGREEVCKEGGDDYEDEADDDACTGLGKVGLVRRVLGEAVAAVYVPVCHCGESVVAAISSLEFAVAACHQKLKDMVDVCGRNDTVSVLLVYSISSDV